MDQFHNNTATR